MDDHDCDAVTPEMEAEVVRVALQQGDLPHAAHHVAGLLAADPLNAEHLALYDQLAEAAGDDLVSLFPLEQGVWYGTVACRSRALALEGRHDEAVSLLCRVMAVMPTVPYLVWARGWPLPGASSAFSTLRPLLELEHAGAWELALKTVVDRALRAYPEDGELAWLGSIGARRSGDGRRAVDLAERSVRVNPSWMGFVALANAQRSQENWEATEQAWEQALALDPADASVLLDWGDTLLDRGMPDEARQRYVRALQREPGEPWAEASIRYIDWSKDATTAGWVELARWARSQSNSPRARWAIASATPWMGYLPLPTDATFHAMEGLVKQPHSRPTSHATSHLEGPSVLWAMHLSFPEVVTSAGEIPTPDPRHPLTDVEWRLWSWEGSLPRPTLLPPVVEVARAVGELARHAYDAERWLGWATRATAELGPDAVTALLSTTMHPPAPPNGIAPHRWLWRVQHAAAFILAAYPGWDGPHADALWSMASVPNDWQAQAALAAVAARAEQDAAVRSEALDMALTVLKSPPDAGAFVVGEAAWYVILRLDLDNDLNLQDKALMYLDG